MKEKYIVITLGLLPFIMVLGNSMLIPILPTIQQALQLTNFEIGLVLSSFSVSAAVLIPLVGVLSDQYGRKGLIITSMILFIGGSMAAIISGFLPNERSSFYLLLMGRIVQGVGAAGTTPLAMALAGDLFQQEKRSKVLGILEVYNGIGKVIAPIIGATAALFAWYSAFYVYPLVAALILYGILRYVGKSETARNTVSIRDYIHKLKVVLQREKAWLSPLFFTGGLGLFLLFGTLYYLSFLIEETYHIDGFFKGTAFAFPLGAMTIASYWTGREIKNNRQFMTKLLLIGLLLVSISFALLIFKHDLSSLMFLTTIAFGGLGFVLPCANMMSTSVVKDEERGFVVSLYGTVRFIGVALGPIVFGEWMVEVTQMFVYCFLLILFASIWLFTKMDMMKVIKMGMSKL
ncbi:MFS transporter [Bacillus songklensis]|uniref:MFS transporter n=1 Tax=Bacillus songklensis TaxID=1069116 RepID=A0ABV8AZD5_9BACI